MSVDLNRFHRSLLDDAINKAKSFASQGRKQDAVAAWQRAAELADVFVTSARTESERERRRQTATQLRKIASEMNNTTTELTKNKGGNGDQEFREAARRRIFRSPVQFNEIAGLQDTIREIRTTFAMAWAQSPTGIDLPQTRNVLFYGPPGCGKTLLAAAASNTVDATFFSVKVSDLLSRYYGDSPKLVQALFEEARSHPFSVVFLDEVDSIAVSRSDGDAAADRRLLVSLLSELDGLNEKGCTQRVLTIAATNRPWELDEAILSRFEKSILIPLPDADARKDMFTIHLRDKGYAVEIPESKLIETTHGLSGREIAHMCKLLIETMVTEANPDLAHVAQAGGEAIRDYAIRVTPITYDHLERVRRRIQPRTSPEALQLFQRWGQDDSLS